MAKSTVDLVQLLRAIDRLDNKDGQCYVTIYSDGSYLLCDGDGNDLVNSEKIPYKDTMSDIHGLAYEQPGYILEYADTERTIDKGELP